MREIGCLMTDPMQRANLSGDKDVTRRIGKTWARARVGDRLWFREVWKYWDWTEDGYPFIKYRCDGTERCIDVIDNDADSERFMDHWFALSEKGIPARDTAWRSSLLMPRSVCRATGIITDIRQVPLQDITEEDALREGMGTLTWADVVELAGLRKALALMATATDGLVRDEATAMRYHNEASMRDRFWLGFSLIHSPEIWHENRPLWRVEWRRE